MTHLSVRVLIKHPVFQKYINAKAGLLFRDLVCRRAPSTLINHLLFRVCLSGSVKKRSVESKHRDVSVNAPFTARPPVVGGSLA